MRTLPRILLIEDQPDVSYVFAMWLSGHGFEVAVASTGAQALAHVDLCNFDVIVCDIGLPDMTGVDLIRLIRAKCDTPAIAFTAYQGFPAGYAGATGLFVETLTKPTDGGQMEAAIRRALVA